MNFSLRASIRAFVAPDHRLSCASWLWQMGLQELARRGEGCHESGAFLLGLTHNGRHRVTRFAYYDDFDPHCLDTGIIVFDGQGYGPLWRLCETTGLRVIADVHTHGARLPARQSNADRDNPMIATQGHIALIIPGFACPPVQVDHIGAYEYLGAHCWRDYSGVAVRRFFYIGIWG